MILLDKYRELYSIIVYICIKKSQFLNELYLKVIEFRHIYAKSSITNITVSTTILKITEVE